ncbi:MAG: alpha/beta hydrolase [Desulfovibrio sp.]|nr:alpha/beta hydrolase [Desulfovibrio sp.]
MKEYVKYLTVNNTIKDLLVHPAFKGFAIYMLPRLADAASDIDFRSTGYLMPWHTHIIPEEVVAGINRFMADSVNGQRIFFSIYDDGAAKNETVLFFFRGEKNAPFALICPGGGFRYVGSLHEGFPLAKYISEHGFNAFVLRYRTGSERIACEDLARTLEWIFKNAAKLGLSVEDYSLWGGSAGARMVANLGSLGTEYFGAPRLPKPVCVIMAYTGHSRVSRDDSPTFSVVSMDDPIADYRVMRERTKALRNLGIDAEILIFQNAGHGFGTGKGSDADGWMDKALLFLEKQIHKTKEKAREK